MDNSKKSKHQISEMKASIKNLKSELKNQQDEYDTLEADN
jgi:uncharacterized protein YhaN